MEEEGEWRVANQKNGEWRIANSEWRMEKDGEWSMVR
jgi:hypothetical protein